MKNKTQSLSSTRLLKLLLLGFIIFLALLCLYYGSSFAPSSRRSDAEDSDPLFGGDLFNHDFDNLHESRDLNLQVPESIPICDERYSELIPCLDRNLIYQLKLKLNLSLMEHYERHCPPPERRYNCLVPPPTGYKSFRSQ